MYLSQLCWLKGTRVHVSFFLFVFVLVSCKLRNQGDTKRKQNVSEHMRDPRMGRPQDEIEVTAWYKGIQTTQVYLNLAISRIISLFFASSCDISSRCARDASNDARFASDGALPCNQKRVVAREKDPQREISGEIRFERCVLTVWSAWDILDAVRGC